jgi:NAD(P)H-dependent FMN reductase
MRRSAIADAAALRWSERMSIDADESGPSVVPAPSPGGVPPSPRLLVVIGSTRPGRIGRPIGLWFAERARAHDAFEVEVVDLAELALPFLDEPTLPRLRRYAHAHTKAWSATVERSDAIVFVTPEYNHGYPAPLKNAIDFLFHEWARKPVGFVSYGGVAAGSRAVKMLQSVAAALRMVPVLETVSIPFIVEFVDEGGRLHPSDMMQRSAATMLDELARLEAALRPIRESARAA